jgi:hypothetical protein
LVEFEDGTKEGESTSEELGGLHLKIMLEQLVDYKQSLTLCNKL